MRTIVKSESMLRLQSSTRRLTSRLHSFGNRVTWFPTRRSRSRHSNWPISSGSSLIWLNEISRSRRFFISVTTLGKMVNLLLEMLPWDQMWLEMIWMIKCGENESSLHVRIIYHYFEKCSFPWFCLRIPDSSNLHPVGTCAMLPRELGGVVDAELKVYGTSNVRVVDASILPFQVCGHLTSTLYGAAEKAARIIKQQD